MSKVVSIDMGAVVGFLKKIGPDVPELLEMATASGVEVPGFVSKYAGLAIHAISKYVGSDDSGLHGPNLPTERSPGRGRLKYLQHRDDFKDDDVVRAVGLVLSSGLPGAKSITDTLKFTLGLMHPGTKGEWDNAQQRQAFDRVLDNDVLAENQADRLGFLVWYALENGLITDKPSPPPPPPPVTIEEE